jgi:hypothetical protein
MEGAARFSRQCGDLQRANIERELGPFFDEQRACVSACIMLAVASIESNINERLAEPTELFPTLTTSARDEFCRLVKGLKILEKYDGVLAIRGLPPFDRGKRPYQDVSILISIRNELVHFHPEWHDEQKEHKKLGQKLSGRFELSPFIPDEAGVIFPDRFVSHGCTKWAVTAAVDFVEDFASRIDLSSRLDQFRDRLLP